jgi:hypothetical protein
VSTTFSPPKAEIGDMVFWHLDGSPHEAPRPAVVTGVGNDTLMLNIIDSSNMAMRLRDGVFHMGDPRCGKEFNREAGGWRHRPAPDAPQAPQAPQATEASRATPGKPK